MTKERIVIVKERSKWTDSDVEKRARTLMMERGVLDPGEFVSMLPTEPERPIPVDRMYEVGDMSGLLTVDLDFAQEASTKLQRYDYDWVDGERCYRRPPKRLSTSSVALYDAEDLRKYRDMQRIYEEAVKEDAKRREAWEEANEAVEQAYRDAAEECRSALAEDLSLNHVKETLDQYVELSGSRSVAVRFLSKAFPPETIKDAEDYFGERMTEDVPHQVEAAKEGED